MESCALSTSINHCGDDILREVFSWLSLEDCGRVEQVCFRWLAAMEQEWVWRAAETRFTSNGHRSLAIKERNFDRMNVDLVVRHSRMVSSIISSDLSPFFKACPQAFTDTVQFVGPFRPFDGITRVWCRPSKEGGKNGAGLYCVMERRWHIEILHVSKEGQCNWLEYYEHHQHWPLSGKWEKSFQWSNRLRRGMFGQKEHRLVHWLLEDWKWAIKTTMDDNAWQKLVARYRCGFNDKIQGLLHCFPDLEAQAPERSRQLSESS